MLPKAERLKEKSLFNIAFNTGKRKKQRLNSSLLSLYYLFKKDINRLTRSGFKLLYPKVAFIVGIRVDKKANKRNLIKRRMRAAYKMLKKELVTQNENSTGVFIWIANPGIKEATFQQIRQTMSVLISKIAGSGGSFSRT
ncbi:MAG: hypothetical protein A3B68_05265 [Candidatus Melainabacteria bacterium RIFCSPHIGHO2_02_FULL_34_12]|nr:MAG: hypothetical protein A3B68_05265 [Candidatus Melainabacteria bacterium RIFCSPHIGHO2_02_FULL_34_12]